MLAEALNLKAFKQKARKRILLKETIGLISNDEEVSIQNDELHFHSSLEINGNRSCFQD